MDQYSWWEAQKREALEQGDIISALQVQPVVPLRFLSRGGTGKGGKAIWEESEKRAAEVEGGAARVLGSIAGEYAVVLTYGCEIEKMKPAHTVLVAPITSIESLAPAVRDQVIRQEMFRYFPLMGIPGLGDYYANLGRTFPIQLRLIEPDHRMSSMSDDAIKRLQAQIVGFYTRKSMPL